MERPVAIIFHRFGPYHCARVRAVAAKAPVVGIEVVRKDSTYQWDVIHDARGFRRVTLFPELEGNQPSLRELRRRLYSCLEKEHPRAVAIPGWSAPYALLALNWCLHKAIPAVLMADSTVLDKRRISLAEWVKGRLLRLYSSALTGGGRQIEYLRLLGFTETAIFPGYPVVDNAHFQAFRFPDEGGVAARSSFLVCCRFDPVKNLPRLLEAYARYRQAAGSSAWDLVLAGDGPERDKLVQAIRMLGLDGSVRLPGFVQYGELPALYARAGVLILPSVSETWGLVVNEAMAAGLPVLVSNRCGCAPELVEEGRNGFTFDPYDIEGLARLMVRMSTMSDAERAAMGQASREIISRWTPETFATNLVKAVEAALAAPRPKATLLDKFLLWALIHRPATFL